MEKNSQTKPEKGGLPKKWIGLPSARFFKYRSWINRGFPGICGTYCAAVLLHDAVFQKTRKSLGKQSLLAGMQEKVDDLFPYEGTFLWDLAHGLRSFLKDVPYWQVKTGLIPERIVPRILGGESPVPVIVGTTVLFNSKYRNHWVLVYAFGYNEEGKLYFKAYDNHGKHQAILPASQTISCVWLEEKDAEKSSSTD